MTITKEERVGTKDSLIILKIYPDNPLNNNSLKMHEDIIKE